MSQPRPPHPNTRRLFTALRLSLVVLVSALALVSGCGGQKEPATTNDSLSSPPLTPAPTPPPPETTAAPAPTADLGTKVFVQRCVLCHGPDGRGDGIGSKALNPKPRNFHDRAYMATRTDAQLLEVIRVGKGAMPRWDGLLSEAEITAVLAHVREMGKKP